MSKKKPASGRHDAQGEAPARKQDKAMEPSDEVKLKPIMGIKPGHYLACLYGAVLLLILFFILLYPGISNPGSLITVKSEPWGAAVYVDGVYIEAAPCEIFVAKGRRSLELGLPGFSPKTIDIDVKGRLFASVLFPKRMEVRGELAARDIGKAFIDAASEYAAWTFAGEPSAVYQIPQSLSEGAYRLGYAASGPVRESMEETVAASSRFAVTRAGLRDLVRAKTLLDNRGISPSPISLLGSVEDTIGFLSDNPEAALWLASVLSGDAQSALSSSAWFYEAADTPYNGQAAQSQNAESRGNSVQVGPLNFRMVEGGAPNLGMNFPAGTKVDSFYIADTVISSDAWERFLEERPGWKTSNIETLIKDALVTEEYLNVPPLPGAPAQGVSGISWHAARAFCEWLSGSLPPYLGSWELRLPTEAEWEYAAKTGAIDSGRFWEWCGDPYAPLSFLSVPLNTALELGSPERSVRGGSWVNTAVGNEVRGSLPPSFCSPFVSFRPVIALKGNGQ